MRMYDLIEKKKRGGSLLTEEIAYMVRGFVAGDIPDYQMSAMLMAIYFKGMDDREITDLTLEMAHSGDMVDLSPIEGIKADKHSTGGVGDKTTLVTGPIVATLTPQAATIGPATRVVLSPTPPVLCLSALIPSMGDKSTISPEWAISRVRSVISRSSIPLK